MQDLALQCIPLQELHSTAEALLKDNKAPDFGFEDGLAEALVKWFKTWFKWIDPITCPSCDGKTTFSGMGTPSSDEAQGGAGRVEIHRCAKETQGKANCSGILRFPRYK